MNTIFKFGFRVGQKLGKKNKTVDTEFKTLRTEIKKHQKLDVSIMKRMNEVVESFYSTSTLLHLLSEDLKSLMESTFY